jgi:hypothetical protein
MYECGPNDRQELETIQNLILDRIHYLKEKGADITIDGVLLDYYSLNDEIIDCILNDNSFSPMILGIILVIGAFVAFRFWKLKKKKFKNFWR